MTRIVGRWRPALRIARRTVRRSPGRTVLIAALIGLPIAGAGWLNVVDATTRPTGEALASRLIGTADGVVVVAPYKPITVEPYWHSPVHLGYQKPPRGAVDRDPATVDIARLLPAGSRAERRPVQVGYQSIRIGTVVGSYPVIAVDSIGELARGTYRLDHGRLPSRPDEVALSPSMAEHLGLLSGDGLAPDATVLTADGQRHRAVGLARSVDVPEQRVLWAPIGSKLTAVPSSGEIEYLVDLPAGADPKAVRESLARHGLALSPRSVIVNPTEWGGGGSSGDAAAWAVVVLVIGFGVLEIVLLAGTAFAVGARRQARELGLVTATGGRPTDVRRIVLAQGLVLGLVGAVTGLALAAALAIAGQRWWESAMNTLITDWVVPIKGLLVIGTVGMVAGLAAAIVPAVSAGRQPPMAALTGRGHVAQGKIRIRRVPLVLIVVGVASALVGSTMLADELATHRRLVAENPGLGASGVTPTQPIAMVLFGITAVIAGLVWLLPSLVARAAAIGRLLPLSSRLALRDAARHRHRTGPAAAAIMMAVGGTVAMSFALSNSFAAAARDHLPVGHHGDAVLRYTDGVTGPGAYSPATVDRLTKVLPVEHLEGVFDVTPRGFKPIETGPGMTYLPRLTLKSQECPPNQLHCVTQMIMVRAVSPEYLARFGATASRAADVLRTGQIVVPDGQRVEVAGGQVRFQDMESGSPAPGAPAVVMAGLPRTRTFDGAALIDLTTARQRYSVVPSETHFVMHREPTKEELAAATHILGSEDLLEVERGYQSQAGAATIALLGASGAVTLLGVAIAVALSAAEGRSDLATLAAVGAQPRRRRNLAAAQAWLIGQLGCLLGVGVGALYGYTAYAAYDPPYFAVPWRDLGGILVAVPLFGALLAWLLTRSRLPMVRRIE